MENYYHKALEKHKTYGVLDFLLIPVQSCMLWLNSWVEYLNLQLSQLISIHCSSTDWLKTLLSR